MSLGQKPATEALVIDLLAESRFARCRRRKQEAKAFTCCKQCNKPLLSKWGTLRGTNDVAKAICKACKSIRKGCVHPRLRGFKFSDGRVINMCPDCTKFDGARYSTLNKGKKKPASYKSSGAIGIIHSVSFDASKWQVLPISSHPSSQRYEQDNRLLRYDLVFDEFDEDHQKMVGKKGWQFEDTTKWKRPAYECLSAHDKKNINSDQWRTLKQYIAKEVSFTAKPRKVSVTPNLNLIGWQQAQMMWPGHMCIPHRPDEFDGGTELVPWFRNEPPRMPITPPVQRNVVIFRRGLQRTCITYKARYCWHQLTGWYWKRFGILEVTGTTYEYIRAENGKTAKAFR